jgi:hypothetical protein
MDTRDRARKCAARQSNDVAARREPLHVGIEFRQDNAVSYTLWSRGRLLGESDLGFVQVYSNMRMGWFHPSPGGEKLMPVLTGTGPALRRVGRLLGNPIRKAMRGPSCQADGEWPKDIRSTTAYADLVSSVDELESMALELRDSDGIRLETEHVGIDDVEFKLSFIPKRQRRRLGIKKPAPWRSGERQERYQIQVYFPGAKTAMIHPAGHS